MSVENNTSNARKSRRAFLKGAATIAYVAPLVVSLPAKASKAGYGSGKTGEGPKRDKQHTKGNDKDKDQHEAKYEPENCPDPLHKDGRDKSYKQYAQSPYSSKNAKNKGDSNYQFKARYTSYSKK